MQPCFSPVWDTALTINALVESGMPGDHPAVLQSAAHWMLDKRGNGKGDWRVKNRACDRARLVLRVRESVLPGQRHDGEGDHRAEQGPLPRARGEGERAATADGGGAPVAPVDAEQRRRLGGIRQGLRQGVVDLRTVRRPQRDDRPQQRGHHRADPGNVFAPGPRQELPRCPRAIAYLKRTQHEDGSWYGRWGCNFLYGTWLALWGLRCIGEDMSQPFVRPGGRVDPRLPERRRRLGRAAALLRRCDPQGARAEHPVADRLGADGADGSG